MPAFGHTCASEWLCPKRKAVARGNPIFGTVEPCKLLETRSSWSLKSQCVYGPNEIAPVTFFVKTSTPLTNRSAFASPTEWQDLGEPVADSRSPAPPACCPSLPIFFPSNARWLSFRSFIKPERQLHFANLPY